MWCQTYAIELFLRHASNGQSMMCCLLVDLDALQTLFMLVFKISLITSQSFQGVKFISYMLGFFFIYTNYVKILNISYKSKSISNEE